MNNLAIMTNWIGGLKRNLVVGGKILSDRFYEPCRNAKERAAYDSVAKQIGFKIDPLGQKGAVLTRVK